jgi:DNA-binding response OmpR family regulator
MLLRQSSAARKVVNTQKWLSVAGLESRGNDYIPAPFNPREMVARVQAVLRRF